MSSTTTTLGPETSFGGGGRSLRSSSFDEELVFDGEWEGVQGGVKTLVIRGQSYRFCSTTLSVLLPFLLVINRSDPRDDALLLASGLSIEDLDGKRVWPRHDLERLADVARECSD